MTSGAPASQPEFDEETERAPQPEAARLADEFSGTFGEDAIERLMRESIG